MHINWHDMHAEISFLIKTSDNKKYFDEYWSVFLNLLKNVAFVQLNFIKIFTLAFDIRPELYPVLKKNGLIEEARLRNHYFFNNNIYDAVICSMWNNNFIFKDARIEDCDLVYNWISNPITRKYSIKQSNITKKSHGKWFKNIMINKDEVFLIGYISELPVGVFRLSGKKNKISYYLDEKFHSLKLGKEFLLKALIYAKNNYNIYEFIAEVHKENIPSIKIFNSLNFKSFGEKNNFINYRLLDL